MGKKTKTGKCKLCNTEGELSFEHVPPKSAFNNCKVYQQAFHDLLEGKKAKQSQLGAGAYTLCTSCNTKTGAWYQLEYGKFVEAVLQAYKNKTDANSVKFTFSGSRLKLAKAILTMFVSFGTQNFINSRRPRFKTFLLEKSNTVWPQDIGLYGAIYPKLENQRKAACLGKISNGKTFTYDEICFYPLRFVLTLDSTAPDNCLADLNYLKEGKYEEKNDIQFDLPIDKDHFGDILASLGCTLT